jgi:NHS family xanthosine MFS transporter
MTNGIGAMLGAYLSGLVVDMFTYDGHKNWQMIWTVFAVYALVVAILFAVSFKYKHNPEEEISVVH